MNAPDSSTFTLVICTHNRHALLRSALESIAALRNPLAVPLSVVVVDNSDDSNAMALIEEMRRTMPWPLAGVAAHPANISVARNAGVAAAGSSDIVAFMDDDQQLDPNWLIAVTEALGGHTQDVFFGLVEPVYEAPALVGKTVRTLFSRWIDQPEGYEMFAMGPRKTRGITLGSGNSVFRRSRALTDGVPFDPAFGNAGGEDYDLFCRLQRRGLRFGWVPAAKVSEFVPASRCEPDYVARRLFAGGQAYALAVSRNSAMPRLERWRQRAIAIVQLLMLLPRWALTPRRDAAKREEYRYRSAATFGKLSFRELEPIYLGRAG